MTVAVIGAGYRIDLPFLAPSLPARSRELPLYRRVVPRLPSPERMWRAIDRARRRPDGGPHRRRHTRELASGRRR